MARSAEILQGDESGGGYGGGLFERDVVGLQRQLVVSNGHVFSIGAPGGQSMADGGFAEYTALVFDSQRLMGDLSRRRPVSLVTCNSAIGTSVRRNGVGF